MEEGSSGKESLLDKLSALSSTTLKLIQLIIIDKVAKVAISVISKAIITLTSLLFIFTLNIAIALLIGEYIGKISLGFFIVASFYLVLTIILAIFLHKWIRNFIGEMLINLILHKKNRNE